MPSIAKYSDRRYTQTTDLILESDSEITNLPVSAPSALRTAVGNYDSFAIGSTAFCPSTKNAWVLTASGWVKIT